MQQQYTVLIFWQSIDRQFSTNPITEHTIVHTRFAQATRGAAAFCFEGKNLIAAVGREWDFHWKQSFRETVIEHGITLIHDEYEEISLRETFVVLWPRPYSSGDERSGTGFGTSPVLCQERWFQFLKEYIKEALMAKLQYTLRESLTEEMKNEGKQIVRTLRYPTLDVAQTQNFMAATGTPVSPAAYKAVLENLGEYVAKIIGTGHGVKIDGFGIIYPVVSGVVNADGTPSQGSEPRVELRVLFAKSLQRAITAASVGNIECIKTDDRRPVLKTFTDVASASQNTTLTAGGIAAIDGLNLRFNTTHADEKLVLKPAGAEGGEAIQISQILDNNPSRLTFGIPAELVGGTQYRLVLYSRCGTKSLRNGELSAILTVA